MGGCFSADLAKESKILRGHLKNGDYDKAVDELKNLMESETGVAAIFYAMRHDIESNPKLDQWLITTTIVGENNQPEEVTLLRKMFELAAEEQYTKNWANALKANKESLAVLGLGEQLSEQEMLIYGMDTFQDHADFGQIMFAEMYFIGKLADHQGTGEILESIAKPVLEHFLQEFDRDQCISDTQKMMKKISEALHEGAFEEIDVPALDAKSAQTVAEIGMIFADIGADLKSDPSTAEGQCDFEEATWEHFLEHPGTFAKYLALYDDILEIPGLKDMMIESGAFQDIY